MLEFPRRRFRLLCPLTDHGLSCPFRSPQGIDIAASLFLVPSWLLVQCGEELALSIMDGAFFNEQSKKSGQPASLPIRVNSFSISRGRHPNCFRPSCLQRVGPYRLSARIKACEDISHSLEQFISSWKPDKITGLLGNLNNFAFSDGKAGFKGFRLKEKGYSVQSRVCTSIHRIARPIRL